MSSLQKLLENDKISPDLLHWLEEVDRIMPPVDPPEQEKIHRYKIPGTNKIAALRSKKRKFKKLKLSRNSRYSFYFLGGKGWQLRLDRVPKFLTPQEQLQKLKNYGPSLAIIQEESENECETAVDAAEAEPMIEESSVEPMSLALAEPAEDCLYQSVDQMEEPMDVSWP